MSLNDVIKKVQTRSEDISHGRYVVNAIDEVTEKMFTENNRKPSQYYTPSSLDGCLRQNYYKRTGAPIDNKIEQEVKNCKKALAGTDRHERIQNKLINLEDYGFNIKWLDIEKYIKQMGYDYLKIRGFDGKEYKLLDKRYNLSFKVDGLLKVRDREMIAEIKTDDTHRWQNRRQISKYHKVQGYCYSLSLQVPYVLYIYEERNEFKLKYFEEKITDEQRQKVIDIISKVESYVGRNKLPVKDLSSCKFCKYKEICSQDINVNQYEEVS